MNFLSHVIRLPALPCPLINHNGGVRFASKKASSGAKWQGNCKRVKKYRGLKKKDGDYVTAGSTLATQITLRFFPGLNVGFGKNGNLFAMKPGKVVMSSELTQPSWNHTWIQRLLPRRPDDVPIYKKYVNIIPEKQHNHFKLVECV